MVRLSVGSAPSLRAAAASQRSVSGKLRHHARVMPPAVRLVPRTARSIFRLRTLSPCRAVVDETEADQNGSSAATRPEEPTVQQQEEAAVPPAAAEAAEPGLNVPPSVHDQGTNKPPGAAKKAKKLMHTDEGKTPITELPFEVGSTVYGKVIFSNPKGARVKLDCGVDGVYGYMPAQEGPHTITVPGVADDADGYEPGAYILPVGFVRSFRVNNIPEVVYKDGTGPLISARRHDEQILWGRLVQMKTASQEDHINFLVRMTGANKGGLMSKMQGMPLFVPYANIPKLDEGWWDEESAKQHFAKKNVEVALKTASRDQRKLLGSIYQAEQNVAVSTIVIGGLVWGTIRKITPFGAFVGIDGTRCSGLLHISNISGAHVKVVEDCFQYGDRIRALVIEMDDDFSRISLSTAELEREHGEMLEDPEAVYAAADTTLAELNAAQDGYDNRDGEFY